MIRRYSLEALSTDYQATLSWMKNIGVSIRAGRTNHYLRFFEYWTKHYETATADKGKRVFPDFIGTLYEVSGFTEIFRSLRNIEYSRPGSIREKLDKAVNGPVRSSEESPATTQARNFLFEALVSAKCHNPPSGVEGNFRSGTDAGFLFLHKKVSVECKRIMSHRKLEKNVRVASNQLINALKNKTGSGNRGMVALDA